MPDLHVILAGSLLEFAIEAVEIPVGRVESLCIHPMTLAEFMQARGKLELCELLQKHHGGGAEPISAFAHQQLLVLLSEYLAVGGMPEAVCVWSETQNLKSVARRVFAPHYPFSRDIVLRPDKKKGFQFRDETETEDGERAKVPNYSWAKKLAKVFKIDVTRYVSCGGNLVKVATIRDLIEAS